MNYSVMDIELYPNLFCVGYYFPHSKETIIFTSTHTNQEFTDDIQFEPLENLKFHKEILKTHKVVTFNGLGFDMPVLSAFFQGFTQNALLKLGKSIINDNLNEFAIYKKFRLKKLDFIKHYDLMHIKDGDGSLKLLATRLNSQKLEELPYNPLRSLSPNESYNVLLYNRNDLIVTNDLLEKLKGAIELRDKLSAKYHTDLSSKGDASIAETIIISELKDEGITHDLSHLPTVREKLNKLDNFDKSDIHLIPQTLLKTRNTLSYKVVDRVWRGYNIKCFVGYVKYTPIKSISFESEKLNDLFEKYKDMDYEITYIILDKSSIPNQDIAKFIKFFKEHLEGKSGSPKLPFINDDMKKDYRELKEPIIFNGKEYKCGLGGLHSREKSISYVGNLKNTDVSSYYPNLILQNDFYPAQFGKRFLIIYKKIVDTRALAKANEKKYKNVIGLENIKLFNIAKVTNASLKIAINASFGKFGFIFSKLYDPKMLLQVTISGQLLLLSLIEQLEKYSEVISSNTDGIEYIPNQNQDEKCLEVIRKFENKTGLKMDNGSYKALYAQDVSNYMAIYNDEIKAKGIYGDTTISKNIQYPIVFRAIKDYLLKGKDIRETIMNCQDIREFIVGRTVRGGAIDANKKPIGKVVRYYYNSNALEYHYREKWAKFLTRKDTKALKTTKAKELAKVKDLGSPFRYISSNNTVPNTAGAVSLLNLPKNNIIPNDLSKEFYILLATNHLKDADGYYIDEEY